MALISFTNFGGELPRVPARNLAPPAAQVNRNLLATAVEFRPLQQDQDVGHGVVGAATLYRMARDASGALRTDDTSGWLTSLDERSYVAGQINDDATERTVLSFNDGTQAPREIDATGADRLLGVPAPPKLALEHKAEDEFTLEEAQAWVYGTLVPEVQAAMLGLLSEDQATSRVRNGVPVAGAYAMYGTEQTPGTVWQARYSAPMAAATAAGLAGPELGGYADGGKWHVPLAVLPFWAEIMDRPALEARLRAIESPKDGSQLWTDAQISTVAAALMARFDPAGDSIKAARGAVDASMQDFASAMTFILSPVPVPPAKPAPPGVPEWVYSEAAVGNETHVRSPEWVAYHAALATYEAALKEYAGATLSLDQQKAARLVRARSAQAAAEAGAAKIEAEFLSRKNKLATWLAEFFDKRGAVRTDGNPDGLFEIDADRIVDTRFYIATYVTDWGQESAPGPVSDMLEVDQNDAVDVTVAAPPAGRHITHWRLYRSNVGSQSAAFQFVDERLISTRIYVDSLPGERLGEVCPTMTWLEPPTRRDNGSAAAIKPLKGPDPYVRGFVGMPNGIVAAFLDNMVACCEAFHPYAWPAEYRHALQFPVVGLGVFGQTLFVGTMGNPYLISGSDPASMSAVKLDDEQACVSRRSIVAMGGGCVYASPDGLCFASPNGVELMTGELFAREDWQALDPASIVAEAHEGVYYFACSAGTFALDTVAKKLGRVDLRATAMHRDLLSDHLFFVDPNGRIRKAFGAGRRTAAWRSGRLVAGAQAPLAWLQIDGDQDTNTPAVVRWYGDGRLRHVATITGIDPVRLPAGRYLEHEVEIESRSRITKVLIAGSTLELRNG